ncbi:MAG: hypothetical protein EVA65_15765 [Oceanococcus sp.]|nr:MAG: hypothetical protein EVA65_15765 [Oceanococcus sp.]
MTKTVQDFRRGNLRELISRYDSVADFARTHNLDDSYLRQLLGKHRGFGEKSARKIENAAGVAAGLLDKPRVDFEGRSAASLGRRKRTIENPEGVNEPRTDYLAPSLWDDGEPDYSQSLRVVPVISWVAAGAFDEANDPHAVGDAETWLPCPKKSFGPHTYALRVRGDSMTSPHGRTYPEGSTIFVDPDLRSPANGERIIAKLEGTDEVTFKAFQQDAGRVWLKPLNPQHPPIMEPFKVLGTVIGTWIGE